MINKTFRLFISSTFKDFTTERDLLNNRIFTDINNFCKLKGYSFQLIDLRWGINNESSINQNTLNICLDEVRRCKQLSPKPNFLILAGERYGWIPLPKEIKKDKFEEIISVASQEEKNILTDWYLLDENEIGGQYYLKTRTDKYTDHNIWAETEFLIHKALTNCTTEKLKYNENDLQPFILSATEHEIIEGLLNNDETSNNTIAVFRTGYEKSNKDTTRIKNLKDRIAKKMQNDNCSENILEFEWTENYPEQFTNAVTKLLLKRISDEINEIEQKKDKLDEKKLLSAELIPSYIFPRTEHENQILSYIKGNQTVPMFIMGESGSGKTTLLAKIISDVDINCFFSFYGTRDDSYTLTQAIKHITYSAKKTYKLNGIPDANERNISEVLHKTVFAIPETEKVLIVIDGLDMFHDIKNITQKVFPSTLPENVKIIVSAADKNIIDRFSVNSFVGYNIYRFSPEESSKNLYEALKIKNRQILPENQNKILSEAMFNGTTPLQLKLISEICAAWHSMETDVAIPSSAESIALKHIESMYLKYGHNKNLVLYALSLIAAAPVGITEDELISIMFNFSAVKAYFIEENHHTHNLDKLPFAIWSRLFYDFQGCLSLRNFNNYIVVRFSHSIFYKVITKNFASYYSEAHNQLISFYKKRQIYISNTNYPDIQKVYNLPILIKNSNDPKELEDLLSIPEFIDASVKCRSIDDLISDFQFIKNKIGLSDYLMNLYTCIQNNKNSLLFYKNEFFSCWAQSTYGKKTFQNEEVIFSTEQTKLNANTVFYPYTVDAQIKWCHTENKYAVNDQAYIYICDGATNKEEQIIYIEPHQKKHVYVTNFIWLDKNRIAAATSANTIIVYDLSETIPKETTKISFNRDITSLTFSQKLNLLIYQDKKAICTFSLHDNKLLYKINTKKSALTGVYIDEDTDTLYFSSGKIITTCSLKNGKLLYKSKKLSKISLSNIEAPYFFDTALYKVNKTMWLQCLINISPEEILFYDTISGKSSYILPPNHYDIKKLLVGENKLVFIYSNYILYVDLSENQRLKYYSVTSIKDADWIEINKSIFVLTTNGLFTINLCDFTDSSTDILYSQKNTLSNLYYESYNLKLVSVQFKKLFKIDNKSYCYIFETTSPFFDYMYKKNIIFNSDNTASIVCFSSDGKKAVAYEKSDSIVIFDKDDTPVYMINKLKLSIINNILKLQFSPDSQFLLLWRNRSVQIININDGKIVLDKKTTNKNVIDVNFISNTKLKLLLNDGQSQCFRYINKKFKENSPKNKTKKVIENENVFVFTKHIDPEGKLSAFPYASESTFNVNTMPYNWFSDKHFYFGEKHWLQYENGYFYLDGKKDRLFSADFYDFKKCHINKQSADSSPWKSYLREKNDIMSTLIEYDNHIVLISRMLSSLIVFDTQLMKVISAFYFDGSIIGDRIIDNNTIEIILDTKPYFRYININIPQ